MKRDRKSLDLSEEQFHAICRALADQLACLGSVPGCPADSCQDQSQAKIVCCIDNPSACKPVTDGGATSGD